MRWKWNAREQLRQAGIPIESVLQCIKLGPEKLTQQSKGKFRASRDTRKRVAALLDRARREIRAHNEATWRPNIIDSNSTPECAWKILVPEQTLKAAVATLSKEADTIGKYLRSYGPADFRVEYIVGMILAHNEDFHAWEALAEVLGKDEDYARELRRKAARIRKSKGDSHGSNGKGSDTSHP
jgi:hypothetical protein